MPWVARLLSQVYNRLHEGSRSTSSPAARLKPTFSSSSGLSAPVAKFAEGNRQPVVSVPGDG